jgi:sterol desaturase/sphingolipid hydroxylase (fatty acid hydroxylase superfamily)
VYVDPTHHDLHHVVKVKNYGLGLGYSFVDKALGTFTARPTRGT